MFDVAYCMQLSLNLLSSKTIVKLRLRNGLKFLLLRANLIIARIENMKIVKGCVTPFNMLYQNAELGPVVQREHFLE